MQLGGVWYYPYTSRRDEITIAALGDLHLFNRGCALTKLTEDIATLRSQKKTIVLGMGDYADYIAPGDPRFDPTILPDNMKIEELGHLGEVYVKAVKKVLKPVSYKLLGLLFGNHEWQYMNRHSQRNLHGWLCTEMSHLAGHEVPDLDYSCRIDVCFVRDPKAERPYVLTRKHPGGGTCETYRVRIYAHHGHGAARTSGGKLNSLIAKMYEFDADVFFMAHAHEGQDQDKPVMGTDKACQNLVEQRRVGVRTGAYLRTYAKNVTGWGEIKGFPASCLGYRAVRISPDKRRVVGIELA